MKKYGFEPNFDYYLAEIFCNEVCGFREKTSVLLKELEDTYKNAKEENKENLYSNYIKAISTVIRAAASRGDIRRLYYFLNQPIMFQKFENHSSTIGVNKPEISRFILSREDVFEVIWLLANNSVSNKDCVPITKQVS